MRKYVLSLLFIMSFSVARAQTLPTAAKPFYSATDTTKVLGWKRGGAGTLNFSQVSLQNWAAGGQSSLSVLGLATLFSNYKGENDTWMNTLDLTYGLLKIGKERIRKSDDRIDLLTKYGRNASTDWYYAALVNFRSQLTPTHSLEDNSLVSRFLAPGFILASIGMDYKPNERFSVFLSPLTGKFTIVQDEGLADAGAFGVKPAQVDEQGRIIRGTGERLREEFGSYLNARYRKPIAENITLQTKLDLFSNYLDNPQNIDVNWENMIDMKVNKLITVSIFTHLIYDDDIDIMMDDNKDGTVDRKGPRTQFKETLGVGLSYKF